MAIINPSSPLYSVFPDWTTNDRRIYWLWHYLARFDPTLNQESVQSDVTLKRMADLIVEHKLKEKIKNASQNFLPTSAFEWISENGRQPIWLFKTTIKIVNIPLLDSPSLNPKNRLLALIDLFYPNQIDQLNFSNQLKANWVQKQLQDKELSWYEKTDKQNIRCQIAWEWYQKNYSAAASCTPEFSKSEDVLSFLDDSLFTQNEKLLHLELIKSRFKANQVRESRKNRKQTNISLSDDARNQLDQLATTTRMTKTQLIEHLIFSASIHGVKKLDT